jgi:hypothetical protein
MASDEPEPDPEAPSPADPEAVVLPSPAEPAAADVSEAPPPHEDEDRQAVSTQARQAAISRALESVTAAHERAHAAMQTASDAVARTSRR